MIDNLWRAKILNFIEFGREHGVTEDPVSDEEIDCAVDVFIYAAQKAPLFLLTETLAFKDHAISVLSVVALLTNASDDVLDAINNKIALYDIMLGKSPHEILDCVEMIKSKRFGRGLGSRSQKLIRKVMETWSAQFLEEFAIICPTEIVSLVRLIHPRYNGYSGELVKGLLEEFKS